MCLLNFSSSDISKPFFTQIRQNRSILNYTYFHTELKPNYWSPSSVKSNGKIVEPHNRKTWPQIVLLQVNLTRINKYDIRSNYSVMQITIYSISNSIQWAKQKRIFHFAVVSFNWLMQLYVKCGGLWRTIDSYWVSDWIYGF